MTHTHTHTANGVNLKESGMYPHLKESGMYPHHHVRSIDKVWEQEMRKGRRASVASI